MDGPKIAICKTAFDSIFVINTTFTSKDTYFHHALLEACDAFYATMLDFGYTNNLESYNPTKHQVQAPQKLPFNGYIFFTLVFTLVFFSCPLS